MVTKINKREKIPDKKYKTGDLLEVVRKDGLKFDCIVLEDYGEGFVCKVLNKDRGIGSASWGRYGLKGDSRFQLSNECSSIKKISEATKSFAKSTLRLNESVQKANLSYYEVTLNNGKKITFCENNGFGGWSEDSDHSYALKESYLNSQISKLRYTRESV